MKIITNNQYREIVYGWELDSKWDKILSGDFDYLGESLEEIKDNFTGFIYRNELYSLDEFQKTPRFYEWDAVKTTSFFDGMVIKISDCGDAVIVGKYID